MSVQLLIRYGDPWFMSPDIWFVPGDNLNGPQGLPVEDIPFYICAGVRNQGTQSVSNATINYYRADLSTVVTRVNAHPLGTSRVSLGIREDIQRGPTAHLARMLGAN